MQECAVVRLCRADVLTQCWLCAVSQEIAEELGFMSSDSSEEEVLTTRVVRRRVIIQVNKYDAACAALLCGVMQG